MAGLPPTSGNSQMSGKLEGHLLVIRLSALGDVAMLVPVLLKLIAEYPGLKLTLLTRKSFAPIFKDVPNVEIYEADVEGIHNGVIGLGKLAKELRDLEIDAVADVHNVLRTNVLRSVFYFYGIPVKQIDKGRNEKKALTQETGKVFNQLKSTHQRYADVFTELGYPVDLHNPLFLPRQKISASTKELIGVKKGKWVGIAPFAQHISKVYPSDLMEKVITDLSKKEDIRIFLFGGGKTEGDKLDEFAEGIENVRSLAGKISFTQELAVISNLDTMLSMDSGNAHLAAMYKVPVLTLWGVTHPFAGFGAFAQPMENHLLPDLEKYPAIPTSVYGNKVPEGYEDVMRTIPPGRVVDKVLQILGQA